jgi:uncharacterized membrane protein
MLKFLKNSLLTGLYVLLPILLLWIGIREIGVLIIELATPIADIIGSKYFDELLLPSLIATILIVGVSVIIGAVSKLGLVAATGQKVEAVILDRVPMYQMLKVICGALVRPDESDLLPALIADGEGGGDPCYVMENHGNGLTTVLLPWSPASFAGSIKVIPSSKLQYLECTFDDYSRSVSLLGVGIAECLSNNAGNDGTAKPSMSGE